ncbi:MAG TPA: bifunctional hydroxymethylpyrimidine kinase/phosphomethylpyrimidine kinase [Myxococcota bacterium]|nr:bifunctional hydroxymethylpyrimidine kinase/phosphomethylpyrimidine kinase [Myxococcota bacterium]HRY93825.1 bifunctional hydroxymethylpyrimidine kinase/phosphomethylpyrimidine kinase [Myxococcota bacterium]HSA22176.1 bifunctional hydroxymethylpyrimidine kinase/phosphomethylpyrimidine kinase [Myxococcota bacterium]
MQARVLIAAGSDSGGGAGIQADVKTVTALGGYAATALTAVTAQDTLGVHGVVGLEPEFVALQLRLVLADLGADCVKTGMLHSAGILRAVADALSRHAPGLPVVVDPVMLAKGGAALIADEALAVLRAELVPAAAVLTPNLPEAERLLGLAPGALDSPAALPEAARALRGLGPRAVLLKGGHLAGARLVDVLAWEGGLEVFEDERVDTRHTHGTGCTLASAVACGLAQGMELVPAVRRARAYVRACILHAPGLGRGHGPLGHGWTCSWPG